MRRLGPILTLLAVVSLPHVARAGVIVSYAFDSDTGSTLNISSPAVIAIPPQGSFDGVIQVTYSTGASGEIVDGPATLDVFDLATNLNISTLLFGSIPVTLVGPASAELVDPVDGDLSGNTLSFGGALGSFHAFGSLVCGGTICATAGFSGSTPRAFDGTASVSVPELTLGSIHGILTGLTFTVGGVSIVASLDFNGEETGREQIPEPGAGLLLALASGLLAAARRR